MPERTRAGILAPYRGDAALLAELSVQGGAVPVSCRSAEELDREVRSGLGLVILTEEGCTVETCAKLAQAWRHEPSWSSPAMIAILGQLRRPPAALDRLLKQLPSVSCLKLQRPLGKAMLISAVRNQLDFRDRQLQIRDLLQEAEAREERQRFLHRELDHRVKNILANLNGLLTLTAAGADDVQTFVRTFQGRVSALSRVHERLSDRVWDKVPLRNLITDSLEPYVSGEGQLAVAGPEVLIRPRKAVSLTMVLHELATNASKYGALSSQEGAVDVGWSVEAGSGEQEERVTLDWRERGGPPVVEPERQGFGSRLVRQVIEYDLRGEVEIEFRPDGFHARMTLPLGEGSPPTI